MNPLDGQKPLLAALGHPVIETHISYVVLTGRYVYKIKKAIALAFLDFTTLEARRQDCENELRLNRRFAPTLYLGVVPITGTVESPVIGGDGPVLEYAVKMRQFDQEQLLSRMLTRGALTAAHMDELAAVVAAVHGGAPRADVNSPFGTPEAILQLALQNFSEMEAAGAPAGEQSVLEQLRGWTRGEFARCLPLFASRRPECIRECHGDLHLNNVAIVDGAVTLFDCIEFNESMRWIDVMSDVAFLVMDLRERGRADFAARFLNAYLERTGDYEGAALLPFYVTYRAMVRAKIARLRLIQSERREEERNVLERESRQYLALAGQHEACGAIIMMHGPAGSGKTTTAQSLLERIGAVRVRTDVERKRLGGLRPDQPSASGLESGLYADNVTRRTYEQVNRIVRCIAQSGQPVIADGAFLQGWQRELVRRTAADLAVPLYIVSCSAPAAELKARLTRRAAERQDASEATTDVLEWQLKTLEPLAADEQSFVRSPEQISAAGRCARTRSTPCA